MFIQTEEQDAKWTCYIPLFTLEVLLFLLTTIILMPN